MNRQRTAGQPVFHEGAWYRETQPMNKLDREIFVLSGELNRLPWGDPRRHPLHTILKSKRARLGYRLAISEPRWLEFQARGAA